MNGLSTRVTIGQDGSLLPAVAIPVKILMDGAGFTFSLGVDYNVSIVASRTINTRS